MFRRSHSLTFSTAGRRRPRWPLWLLLGGAAAGAAAVIGVQERLLPPRLTADASARLTEAHANAEAERVRLAAELGQAQQQLTAAVAERQALAGELASSRSGADRLQADLALVVDALPPDPRGGAVAVRAARFVATGGRLDYGVVLTRQAAGGKPMPGLMQLVLTGESARRDGSPLSLEPVMLSLGPQQVLRGSVPLPEGFRAQQATVKVLDRSAGRLLGLRVLNVQEPR